MATTLTLKDLLALSDKLTMQLTLLQNQIQLNDTLSLGDGFQLIEHDIQIKPLANIITLIDALIETQQSKTSEDQTDNLLISDSLQILLAPLLALSDQITLSDTLAIQVGSGLSLSDSLNFTDSAGLQIIENLLLNLSDTLNLSDSIENTSSSDLDNYLRRYLNDVS
jgi:hypothetical protein